MSDISCPVSKTIHSLEKAVDAARFKHPKNRRMASEVLELLEDLAWGRGGEQHVPAIESMVSEMIANAVDAEARSAADEIQA